MRGRAAAALVPALLSAVPTASLAWIHGGGAAAPGIPAISAGAAQPGSADGAWINWAPIAQAAYAHVGSSGTGVNDNVIAEWDNVQYSEQSGTFNVCVIGYHASGSLAAPLASVTFYLDGGTGVSVTAPNLLKTFASGVTLPEYCVAATDSAMNDGQHEFRAIAFPVQGYPRLMASRFTVNETSASTTFAQQATAAPTHVATGDLGKAFVVNANNGDSANFTIGSAYYTLSNASMTPSGYQVSATSGGSAITAGATGALDVTWQNAGLNEAGPLQSESLFVSTNAHGTLVPSGAVSYVDDTLTNTAPCGSSAGAACEDIQQTIFTINVRSDTLTYTFNTSNANIAVSGGTNPLALHQAVVLSGTVPPPFIAGRPYWVLSSSGAAITLGNTPQGTAVQTTSCGGGCAAATVRPDVSNFTAYFICHAPCSSPQGYTAPGSGYTVNPIQTNYGWFNVLPNPGTATANVPLTNGTATVNLALVQKLHTGVDIVDNSGSPSAKWNYGQNDTWLDGFTFTGFDRINKDSSLGSNGGENPGYYAITGVTFNQGFASVTFANLSENVTGNHSGASCQSNAMLNVGNTCNTIGEDQVTGMPMTLTANSPDHFTLITANPPPYMVSNGLGVAPHEWEVGTYPSYGGGFCVGTANPTGIDTSDAHGIAITSMTGPVGGNYTLGLDTNVTGGTEFLCNSGDNLLPGPDTHAGYQFYGYGAFNIVMAGNVCAGICAADGFHTQTTGAPVGFGDIAVVANHLPFYYNAAFWAAAAVQIEPSPNGWNHLFADNFISGGSIGADSGAGYSYTDMYFVANSCGAQSAGTATTGLAIAGWTVSNSSTPFGGSANWGFNAGGC